jgi:hypothetical protein
MVKAIGPRKQTLSDCHRARGRSALRPPTNSISNGPIAPWAKRTVGPRLTARLGYEVANADVLPHCRRRFGAPERRPAQLHRVGRDVGLAKSGIAYPDQPRIEANRQTRPNLGRLRRLRRRILLCHRLTRLRRILRRLVRLLVWGRLVWLLDGSLYLIPSRMQFLVEVFSRFAKFVHALPQTPGQFRKFFGAE